MAKGGLLIDKYCIGLDFGTQSGRALLVRIRDGHEMAVSVKEYEHGVMAEELPSGQQLPPDYALQHPVDYLNVLKHIILDVMEKGGIGPEQVLGLGIATTSSTILPVSEDGTPLCFFDSYADDPHSYIKLWKHHGAQREALELNSFLSENDADLTAQFGASSVERLLPKALETKRKSPHVYAGTFAFVEVADWLVWHLTGNLRRSAPIAGYKSIWRKETGYLTPELLAEIDEGYAAVIRHKLPGEILPMGSAGNLTQEMAQQLGLTSSTVVSTGYIDAHSAVLGAGVNRPGRLVMVMGTTSCHMLLHTDLALVEGMSGAIKDGIVEGFYAYESGQSSVGDQFNWFVENALPHHYQKEAEAKGISVYEHLDLLARKIPLGCTGLLALDWWNGNRSVLNNAGLSGTIVGLTTQSKPEEIYLALLESTAFGARMIMESFQAKGLAVDSICVCGGLPRKNPLLMEIYASVTNRTIEVAHSEYTSALGAAVCAAAAINPEVGYRNIHIAVEKMTKNPVQTYEPDPEIARVYDVLYEEYSKLHDYFGRGGTDVMQLLRKLKAEQGE